MSSLRNWAVSVCLCAHTWEVVSMHKPECVYETKREVVCLLMASGLLTAGIKCTV